MYFFSISILFNLFWFAAVLGRQQAFPFLFITLLIVLIVKPKIIIPSLLMALIGIMGDSLLFLNKILVFDEKFLPLWLCSLWLAFTIYICLAQSFLLQKPKWLLLSIGAIGGALSYIAGEKLGAVNFNYSLALTSFSLFSAWFCYSLLFILILNKFSQKV